MGKKLVFVPECHSTNTLARELTVNGGVVDGTVVITDRQTAGRGQHGNTWESEPGRNLTFSMLLKPGSILVRDQFFLNIFTALAIHDLLSGWRLAGAAIKWPNDILVHEKKICGILIENQIQGQQVSYSTVGIGLNINQTTFAHATATSVMLESGRETPLQDAFEALIGYLEHRYLQLRRGDYAELRRNYLDRLFGRGELRRFVSAGTEFSGSILGIDDLGQLLIETPEGHRRFRQKELQYCR